MMVPPTNNHYALMAFLLSPWKNAETIESASAALEHGEPDWMKLLYLANLHFCAPLWFVRLKQDGLLARLPGSLQTYLRFLHQSNVERNDMFRQALGEIDDLLHENAMTAIVLKGAATFLDDLYKDSGARMMGDIDILLEPTYAVRLQKLLIRSGYIELPDHIARHHLLRLIKPGSPVAVEIHYKVSSDQGGRLIPFETAWRHRKVVPWLNLTLSVLDPTYRLMHNAVHALVSHRSFIESTISLSQLAEFSYLGSMYRARIDWHEWLRQAETQDLRKQFRIYLSLAHRLMNMPIPDGLTEIRFAKFHADRIAAAGNARSDFFGIDADRRPRPRVEKWKVMGCRLAIKAFHRLNHPKWLWHNKFKKEGRQSITAQPLFIIKTLLKSLISDFRLFLKSPFAKFKGMLSL